MSVAREPVRFNEQDDNRTTITKLNRLVDELYTKLAAAELRVTQVLKFTKDPTVDYVLTSDADGKASWAENLTTEPGGSDTQVQFNDGGSFGGDAGLIYDKAANQLTVSGDVILSGEVDAATLDISGNGDVAGTLDVHGLATLDTVVIDGTETDELINMARTIDAEVTKPGVSLHEIRTGMLWVGSAMNGFEYKSTLSPAVGFVQPHNGFYSEIDHTSGTVGVASTYYAKLSSASGTIKHGLYAGAAGFDSVVADAAPAFRGGLLLSVKGSAAGVSGALYGAYTKADSANTGVAYGYMGYGNNTYGTPTVTENAIGVLGFCNSSNGIAVGLKGCTFSSGAKKFSAHLIGHNWLRSGNTYIRTSASITTITDAMADQWNEVNDGNLYVEGCIECGNAIQFGERSSDAANPSEGNAVMWMSDGTGAGADGDIMMKITAGAVTKTKTLVTF